MTIVRRILATAVVAGTLAVLPISVLTSDIQSAGGIGGGTTIVTTNGGQGGWPFKP